MIAPEVLRIFMLCSSMLSLGSSKSDRCSRPETRTELTKTEVYRRIYVDRVPKLAGRYFTLPSIEFPFRTHFLSIGP